MYSQKEKVESYMGGGKRDKKDDSEACVLTPAVYQPLQT
jgi:hypothetical protein